MANYLFTTLDDTSAAFGTYATGINKYGEIVGYYIDATGQKNGFVYGGGTYTTVDDPKGPFNYGTVYTVLTGINDSGQIVGYEQSKGAGLSFSYGFVYQAGTFSHYGT